MSAMNTLYAEIREDIFNLLFSSKGSMSLEDILETFKETYDVSSVLSVLVSMTQDLEILAWRYSINSINHHGEPSFTKDTQFSI